jgi:glycosyltransferase involved in cell wall biosynthesis
MRILLISGEFPPMQGGVGDYTCQMARAFVLLGHQVDVLVPNALEPAYHSPQLQPWRVWPRVHGWKWNCWSQVIAVVREVRPDVINLQYQAAVYDMRHPAVNLLPWRLRRLPAAPPVVVTFHDLKPPYLFPKAGAVRGWAVRQLARHSRATIVTNAEDLESARRWHFFATRRDQDRFTIHQIPIGSNIAAAPPAGYDREAWRSRFGYGPDDLVWAYFGFLNESKGAETLIRALAKSTGSRLLMIGGRVGSSDATNRAYAARIEALIGELGLTDRVQWTGYVPEEQVSAAFLGTDVVVMPYRDGVSFRRGSLHAALAHGCAIVSTTPRVPLPELGHGENILLVPPQDPQALSEAVLRLRDPALRRRIGDGARVSAQQFTWERIAQRTVDEVFRPLIHAGSPGMHI